jgi:tetratricopeptide (TPR) repeat protein
MYQKINKKILFIISAVLLVGLAGPGFSPGAERSEKKMVVVMPFSILSKANKKDPVLSWLAEGTDEEIHLKLSSLTEIQMVQHAVIRKALQIKEIDKVWEIKDKSLAQVVAQLTMDESYGKTQAYVLLGAWDRSGDDLRFKARFVQVEYKKKPKENWELTTLKSIEKRGTLQDVHVWMVQATLEFLEAVGVRPSANHEADIRRIPTGSAKAFTLVCKARLALTDNKFDEALGLFKEALAEDSQYSNCAYELGTLYYLLKEYRKALKTFDKAVEVRGDFSQAYRYKALSQYALDDFDGALTSFKRAVEIDPEDAGSTYNISCIYSRRGEIAEAVAWLKKAMIMDPSRYRTMAQRDPDLDNIRQDPRFKELCN